MAAAISLTLNGAYKSSSAALSGAAASTSHVFAITHGSGSVQNITAKTDGSGAATVNFVLGGESHHATITVTATPVSTVAATATGVNP